jgi:hypothetical protein
MFRISDRDKKILECLVQANDVTFSVLAQLAKLDPRSDFRFSDLQEVDFRDSDLRGYDFTGSNLLGAIRNERTILDSTTILTDARVGWIEANSSDIIQKMQSIQGAMTSSRRKQLLVDLIENYRSAAHIRQFLLTSIRRTNSIEAFFDFSDAIQSDGDEHVRAVILEELHRLVESKGNVPDRKKKVGQTPQGFNLILKRVEDSLNPTIQTVGRAAFQSDGPPDRPKLLSAIGRVSKRLL